MLSMAVLFSLLFLLIPKSDCNQIKIQIEKAKGLVNSSNYQEALNQIYSVKRNANYCDEITKTALYHQLAVIHLYSNSKDSAIFYTRKTLQNSYALGNDSIRIKSLTNLGMLLNQVKRYDEALKQYREVWKYYNSNPNAKKKEGNDFKKALASSNLALTHLNLKNRDSSIYYISKSFDFRNKEKKLGFVIYNFNLASEIYEQKGDLLKAIAYSDSSLNLAKIQNDKKQVHISISRLMNLSMLSNNLEKASTYEEEIIQAINDNDELIFKRRFLSVLYDYYKATKQNLKALQAVENLKSIADSITKFDYEAKVLALNSEYSELRLKNQNLEYLIALKKNEKRIFYLIISLCISASIIIFGVLRFRYERIKLNTYFEHEKDFKQFYNYLKSQKTTNAAQSSNKLFLRLLNEINEKKLYLDPNIRSKNLAQILGTNTKYLSSAVNISYGKSISHLLNFYRIEEAKGKIEKLSKEKNKLTVSLNSLWEECGFNSNVHFYRVFKKFTRLTPLEYHTFTIKFKKTKRFGENKNINTTNLS